MFGIDMTFEARLGADPELRYMPSGDAVASVRAAVDNGTNQRTSEKLAPTWLELSAWEDLAEQLHQDYHRGDLLRFTGKLTQRTYTNRAGQTVTVLGCRLTAVEPVFPGDGRYAKRRSESIPAGTIPHVSSSVSVSKRFHPHSYRDPQEVSR